MSTTPSFAPVPDQPTPREWNRTLAAAILIGFGLRLAWVLIGGTYQFGGENHYLFGHEYGAVARAIASGRSLPAWISG